MTAARDPIRVQIADDQPLVRAGLRAILEAEDDLVVVAEAADGREAVEQAALRSVDVACLDIRMPVMDGIEATRRLGELPGRPPPKVLVLTTFELDEYVVDALRAGASGFLLKDTPPEELVRAVRVVAAGEALLAPSVTRRLLDRFAAQVPAPGPDGEAALAALTEREREVLLLVARGLSNAEIARSLVVSDATVKTHVAHVLGKLGLRDRIQAVILAYETGLVRPGSGPG